MKTLLLILIIGTCAIAWRGPDLIRAISMGGSAQGPATISEDSLNSAQRPMSVEEFARLARTDPQAYQKFLNSYRVQKRDRVDKLLNFIARGTYE